MTAPSKEQLIERLTTARGSQSWSDLHRQFMPVLSTGTIDALLAHIQQSSQHESEKGWFVSADRLNDIQMKSIQRQIARCKQAHFVNLKIRINGDWEEGEEADWIKHLLPVLRPRLPESEGAGPELEKLQEIADAVRNLGHGRDVDGIEEVIAALARLTAHPVPTEPRVEVSEDETPRGVLLDVIESLRHDRDAWEREAKALASRLQQEKPADEVGK